MSPQPASHRLSCARSRWHSAEGGTRNVNPGRSMFSLKAFPAGISTHYAHWNK